MEKILIVSPHPDDAELAMGGFIAKSTAAENEVLIVELTDGEPTPFGSKEIRNTEARQAADILSARKINLGMPNRRLACTISNCKKLAEVIRQYRPDMMFWPMKDDFHPDHIAANKIAKTARFYAKLTRCKLRGEPIWVEKCFGYFSPHRCLHDKANFIVDVTDFWETKRDAILSYQSQLKNVGANGIDLLEKVEVVNRYFGLSIGRRFAEPFVAYQPIELF